MKNPFHEFLNPHCEHCKNEREDIKICHSCETLKLEIERLRDENERLLDRLLAKPEPIIETGPPKDMKVPKHIPWNVRRQMLEQEDREKARLMSQAPQPLKDIKSVEELEKELGVENALG